MLLTLSLNGNPTEWLAVARQRGGMHDDVAAPQQMLNCT
jgi:hypothetical protein